MPHKPLAKNQFAFSTQWRHSVWQTTKLSSQRKNKYKHSCSTVTASPWFNYRSCQSRGKNTAPDTTRRHSLILHGPFSHPEAHRHLSANSQTKPWDGGPLVAPHTQVTLQCRVSECLRHLRNGVYSTSRIVPVFSQAQCICTTMTAASRMNKECGVCSYLSPVTPIQNPALARGLYLRLKLPAIGRLLQDAEPEEMKSTPGEDGSHPQICMMSAQHGDVTEWGECRPAGYSTKKTSHGSHFREETHTCYFQRSQPDVTLQLKQWCSVTLTLSSSEHLLASFIVDIG